MDERIKSFFAKENIEYYAALDYSAIDEINPRLNERAGLVPKSVILFLIPYYACESVNLSTYAASLDYHLIIKRITGDLCALLSEIYPEYNFVGFGDHSPIDERSAALKAGLGILGKNGLIINEKYGSYVFLADVISDIPSEFIGTSEPIGISFCSGCGACLEACPTGILIGEGKTCLSEITQRKGELTAEEIDLMLKCNTVWGCDVCQSVCPYNKNAKITPIDFFKQERIDFLTSEALESMSDEDFKKRAFAWRGRKTIERNLKYYENAIKCK